MIAAVTTICLLALTFGAARANAAFTIAGWGLTPSTTQAGGHPNVSFHLDPDATKGDQTGDDLKTVKVEFAAGMLANPAAVTPCTATQFSQDKCPTNTNLAAVTVKYKRSGVYYTLNGNMYLLTPDANNVASFGIIVRPSSTYQKIYLKSTKVGGIATVRTGADADYGVDVTFDNIPRTLTTTAGNQVAITISDITVNLYARTNNSSSNPYFTYNPTRCDNAWARATSTSYLGVSDTHTSSFALTGCSSVPFTPGFTAQMDNGNAGAPTGIKATVTVPQTPATIQQSHVKTINVTLPNGTGLNFPAISAVGALCTDAQLAADTCPAASQIGTTSVDVPLLPPQMTGKIYLMTRGNGITFGYTFHGAGNTLVTLKGAASVVDLDGDTIPDAVRAQLLNLPQAPFTQATLDFDAQLINNPQVCGSAAQTITAAIAGWSGASATKTATYTVSGDCVPDTAIETRPPNPNSSSTGVFTFSASIAGAGFECSIDAAAFAACTSPYTTPTLADGSHTFAVRAVIASGADPTPDSYTWVVDTVPPTLDVVSPAEGAYVTSATVAVAFTATDANGVGSTTCALDAAAPSACTSPQTFSGVGDGAHSFTLFATDSAGNTASLVRNFKVDTTPPNTTITSGPPALSNTGSAAFAFSSSESASSFRCRLDYGSYSGCVSGQAYAGLADGTHTFFVAAVDPAGNVDPTPAMRAFTVYRTSPETTITSGPPSLTTNPNATFTIGSSAAELPYPPGCDPRFMTCLTVTYPISTTLQCSLDGAAYSACTSTYTVGPLADGAHSLAVRAVDEVGNVDPTPATYSWTIDTTPPETAITSAPPNPSTSSTAMFQFASNESGSTFACSLDGAAYSSCTSPKTFSGLAYGMHTFNVRATDAAGNTDPTPATYTWDNAGENFPPAPSCTVSGSTVTCTWAMASNVSYTCQLDGSAAAACTSPKTYAGVAVGSHTFAVCATDASGNVACGTTTFVVAAPLDFTITCTPGTTSITCYWTITGGAPPYTSTCRLDGGSATACTSPATFSGLSNGTHMLTVCVTDSTGQSVCKSYTWTPTPPPIVTIASPASGSAIGSSSVSVSFTGTGSTPLTFQCQLDGGAWTTCASPKTYMGLSEGSHTICVTVTDVAGNSATKCVTFIVDTTPPLVVITSPPNGALLNSATQSVTFTSTDAVSGVASKTCKVDANAASNCTSPFNPPALTDGAHTICVYATDFAGNVGSACTNFIVDTTPPDTLIDSGPPNPTNSASAAFTFHATESGSTFACSLDGSAFSSCTSPRSYSGLADGSHTFQVRATDAAGNTDPTPASYTWAASIEPPNTIIDSGPPNPTSSSSATFTFHATASGSMFACSLDGAAFSSCTSPKSYSGLADGSHTFQVRATDSAGNTDPTPAIYPFTILPPPPGVTITATPGPASGSTTPSYSFATTGSPTPTATCSIDGAAPSACSSPWTTPSLADQAFHTVTICAVNTGGTSCKSATVWLDTRAYGSSVSVAKLSNSITPTGTESNPAAHPSVSASSLLQGAVDTKALTVTLPHGLTASLAAIPSASRCTDADYASTATFCPASSTVGAVIGKVATTDMTASEIAAGGVDVNGTAFLMSAPSDNSAPARIAVKVAIGGGRGDIIAQGAVNLVNNISNQMFVIDNIPTTSSSGVAFHALALGVTVAGDAGAPGHPMITNQSYCFTPTGTGLWAPYNNTSNAYGYKGQYTNVVSDLTSWGGASASASAAYPVSGCSLTNAPYDPSVDIALSNPTAGSDTAVRAALTVPVGDSSTQRFFSKLPPKVGPNFAAYGDTSDMCPSGSVANNYSGSVGIGNTPFNASSCPARARIGQVEITSPVLENPVVGDVYLIQKPLLPWLGVQIDPSVTNPARAAAGMANPSGMTADFLITTGMAYYDQTCDSGSGNCYDNNGNPVGGYGSGVCDTATFPCQQQMTLSMVSTPDLPMSHVVFSVGKLADGSPLAGRLGSGAMTSNNPLRVAQPGDETCGVDPFSPTGAAYSGDAITSLVGWSQTTAIGTAMAGGTKSVTSPIGTPGCGS